MFIIIAIIGGFIGRFLIGGILNFVLKQNERNNPNPENYLGWIGSIIGAIIAIWIYKS